MIAPHFDFNDRRRGGGNRNGGGGGALRDRINSIVSDVHGWNYIKNPDCCFCTIRE